jgi:hypothetical protein
MTPYNTGKVQIGLLYEPPKPYHDRDACLLQTALLNEREAGALERLLVRLIGRFWRFV